jgi:tripartite-type tricarboxylate transporter receptor subunit TctC
MGLEDAAPRRPRATLHLARRRRVVASGPMAQALARRGVTARFRDGETTRALIAAERAQWGRIIREEGITPSE